MTGSTGPGAPYAPGPASTFNVPDLRGRRRTLRTGAGLLTDAQVERLEALLADERHAPVTAARGVYQRLIQVYRTVAPGLGKHLTQRRIDSLG